MHELWGLKTLGIIQKGNAQYLKEEMHVLIIDISNKYLDESNVEEMHVLII